MSKSPVAVITGDSHLKSLPWSSRPDVRGDTFFGFNQIHQKALELNVPLVLLGDTFDSPRPPSIAVDFLKRAVERQTSNQKEIYAIDGNHDLSRPSWIDTLGMRHLSNLSVSLGGITFCGIDWKSPDELADSLQKFSGARELPHVLCMHQLVDTFNGPGIANLAATWLPAVELGLLGDMHKTTRRRTEQTTVAYPGSCALLSWGEPIAKNYWILYRDHSTGLPILEVNPLTSRPAFDLDLTSSVDPINVLRAAISGLNNSLTQFNPFYLSQKSFNKDNALWNIVTALLRVSYPLSLEKDVKSMLEPEASRISTWFRPVHSPQTFFGQSQGTDSPVDETEQLVSGFVDQKVDPEAFQLALQLAQNPKSLAPIASFKTNLLGGKTS